MLLCKSGGAFALWNVFAKLLSGKFLILQLSVRDRMTVLVAAIQPTALNAVHVFTVSEQYLGRRKPLLCYMALRLSIRVFQIVLGPPQFGDPLTRKITCRPKKA